MIKLACAEDKTRVLSQFLLGCFRMKSWHLTRDQKGDKKPDKGSSRERPEEGRSLISFRKSPCVLQGRE